MNTSTAMKDEVRDSLRGFEMDYEPIRSERWLNVFRSRWLRSEKQKAAQRALKEKIHSLRTGNTKGNEARGKR